MCDLKITTEQATAILAALWEQGEPGYSERDLAAIRSAYSDETPETPDYDREARVLEALGQARGYGAEWHWQQAGVALRRAYGLVGSEGYCYEDALSEGTAWHRGEHPLQAAKRGEVRS